ncbi:MAG: OadG family transporter subunit [Pseudomonadota bacterium]
MAEGLELMLVGMGTVFVFLTTLVFATTAMSALVQRFLPEPEPAPAAGSGISDEEIAAITIAIAAHRRAQDR